MNKSMIFDNVYVPIEDGKALQVLYYHKGFVIIDMDDDDDNVGTLPLTPEELSELLSNHPNAVVELTESEDCSTIEMLDEIVRDAEISMQLGKESS